MAERREWRVIGVRESVTGELVLSRTGIEEIARLSLRDETSCYARFDRSVTVKLQSRTVTEWADHV